MQNNAVAQEAMTSPAPIPAEWARQRALYIGFPSHRKEWLEDLESAQDEVAEAVNFLGPAVKMRVLADGEAALTVAKARIQAPADIIPARLGDIWLRDTGPIFARGNIAHCFHFNGWGGKYIMPGDETVNRFIAEFSGATPRNHGFIMEGGSLDTDGEGTVLTTRQCLLNPNRNPGWDQKRAEAALKEALGFTQVLWLDEGLAGDHTDGHIDNIARFIAPGRVVCQHASGADDPNAGVLRAIETALSTMRDAVGRKLEVVTIPSPGRVEGKEGGPAAASHMNFIIANGRIALPVYNDLGEAAVAALAKCFPGYNVKGFSARAILTGGGAFHCITQQEPEFA